MRLNPPTPPTTTRVEFFAFEKERAERADRYVPTTFFFTLLFVVLNSSFQLFNREMFASLVTFLFVPASPLL